MFAPVPAPSEMSQWDAQAIALGIPEDVLMENAARAAFSCLKRHYAEPLAGKSALLFAGGGNNGGDAFCMARLLQEAGADPLVVCTRPPRHEGAAKRWYEVMLRLGIPVAGADEWSFSQAGISPDIIIDGLLGTGFKGALREKEMRLVEGINHARGAFVLSIDIPSGLDGMTGLPCPMAVRADATVTFQAPKPGLILPAASCHTGILEVHPIGMPRQVCSPSSFRTWRMPCQQADGCEPWTVCRGGEPAGFFLRPRPEFAWNPKHKGDAGKVLVIGGCRAYAGAPCLAALAAMRAGCGLAAVAAPDPVQAVLRHICPAAISLAFRDDAEEWQPGHTGPVIASLGKYDALVLGPGLGRGEAESALVEAVLGAEARPPAVIDADALYALSARKELFGRLGPRDILTPHPGEAASLLGCSAAEVQSDRFEALQKLSALSPAVCVLKGEGTLIAAQGEVPVLSPWAVPQLAVAGSGDVLAGVAAAFLARGLAPVESATLAVWTHALAGVSLAGKFPMRGNSPVDIADAIPIGMQWAGLPPVRNA